MCKKSFAFTLVELLIVVSIIGILAGVTIAVINPAKFQGKARDGVRKNDIAVIKGAIEIFYSENNSYPATGGIPFGGSWASGGTTYLKSVPSDPKKSFDATYPQYCYLKNVDGSYLLCAKVEDANSAGTAGICNAISYDYCVQNPF